MNEDQLIDFLVMQEIISRSQNTTFIIIIGILIFLLFMSIAINLYQSFDHPRCYMIPTQNNYPMPQNNYPMPQNNYPMPQNKNLMLENNYPLLENGSASYSGLRENNFARTRR